MNPTPEGFADAANNSALDQSNDDKIKDFLKSASPREIQRFIHQLNTLAQPTFFQFARTALDIRLAEDAEKTSRRIVWLTWGLIILTFSLLAVTVGLYKDTYKNTQCDQLQRDGSSK